jgi:D-alanyl-lipoteichoic acid acyltransferase DltB (MBOAT superfamily)
MLVFTVSGLWHGAAWTFVIWGALHGSFLVVSRVLAPLRLSAVARWAGAKLPRAFGALETIWIFLLALLGWIFFRARSVSDAWYIVTHCHSVGRFRFADLFSLGLPRFEMALALLMILVLMLVDWCLLRQPAAVMALWKRRPVRWGALATCFYAIVFFGVFAKLRFIYFQF